MLGDIRHSPQIRPFITLALKYNTLYNSEMPNKHKILISTCITKQNGKMWFLSKKEKKIRIRALLSFNLQNEKIHAY